jgi:outer membrane lipoprotein SlyB
MITQVCSLATAIALGAGVLVSACATPVGGNTYPVGRVGDINRVEEGTVVAVRAVTIEGNDRTVGTATGAVVGGVAGSQVGGDDEARAVGAVVGAVLGGIAGNAVQGAAQRQTGFAYTIRLRESGDLITITQGDDIAIAPGTPVFVEHGARARVFPR